MKSYEITNPAGLVVNIQLDDEEAERLGLAPVKERKPANKQATPKNK